MPHALTHEGGEPLLRLQRAGGGGQELMEAGPSPLRAMLFCFTLQARNLSTQSGRATMGPVRNSA